MFYVRTSIPTFQNLAKQDKFQEKTIFTTDETVGLVEWIIDDTWLAKLIFNKDKTYWIMQNKFILAL